MKFKEILTVFTLILIFTESQQNKHDIPKIRLGQIINQINKIKLLDSDRGEIAKTIDMDCTKNMLRLPQDEKMIVNVFEENIFEMAAFFKCSSDPDKAVTHFIKSIAFLDMAEFLQCFKWQLMQLEPESDLIKNFVISESEVNMCKEVLPLNDIKIAQGEFEEVLGPMEVFSCGVIRGADDFIELASKSLIIEKGDISEEVKLAEKKKLIKNVYDKGLGMADCLLNRFEKDPKSYLINNTLNYFVGEATYIDSRRSQSYKEKLQKLYDNIDMDCTKEKLNLGQNGNLAVLEGEAKSIIASAMSKCIKIDQLDFAKLFLNYSISGFERSAKIIYCANYHLKKLEPTSRLVKDLTQNQKYEEECHYYENLGLASYTNSVNELVDKSYGIEHQTCSGASDDFLRLTAFKMVLLAAETDAELINSESNALFVPVIDKLQKFGDCVLTKVQQINN